MERINRMKRRIKTNRFSNAILAAAAGSLRLLPGGRRVARPSSVLVVRLGNLGDIIVALPAFHALRRMHPDARLTLLTSPTLRGQVGAAEVLASDRTFDDTIVYYADESQTPGFLRRLRAELAARRIDHAVLLPNHLTGFSNVAKFLALFASAGIRSVAGARLVVPKDYEITQVERLVRLVGPDASAAVEPPPWLVPSPEDAARADALLQGATEPLVALHAGAKRPANRWPLDRFAEVGRRLAAERGATVVLTGSPGEKELTGRLRAAIGEGCIDLAGQTTVGELAAVLGRCAAIVSNDTGVMHVAEAVGTPVVAIFSARFYRNVWFPYGSGHTVLYRDIECSPCQRDVCPLYEEPDCLRRISVDDVLGPALALLSAPRNTERIGIPGTP
jgi:ADP-heptose:LPS heptosyltransferase